MRQRNGKLRGWPRTSATAVLIVLIVPHLLACSASRKPQRLLLASGSPGGVYHQVALEIERVFNQELAPYRLTAVTSSGAVENLHRLQAGLTDWAIIQRNIAARAYFDNQFRQIEVLLPLFPEAMQIFVRDASSRGGVMPFSKFLERCRDGRIRKLAVGPTGSGSHEDVKMILSLWGIGPSDDLYYDASGKGMIEAFEDGSVDALALMWAYPFEDFSFADSDAIALVSMGHEDLGRALAHSDHFDRATIPEDSYPFAARPVHTVATWALLVARNAAGTGDITSVDNHESVPAVLLDHAGSDPEMGRVADALGLPLSGETGDSLRGWQQTSFFRGLPLSSDLEKQLDHGSPLWLKLLGALLVAAVAAGATRTLWSRSWPRLLNVDAGAQREFRGQWTRYQHGSPVPRGWGSKFARWFRRS